jgi:hypothetical protein
MPEQKTDIKLTEKSFSFKGGDCELNFDFFGEVCHALF